MKGVTRGERVEYSQAVNDMGQAAPAGVGIVLDHAAAPTCWWVMPEGQQRAVCVKASAMEPAKRTVRR